MLERQQVEIHGHRVSYLAAGDGPLVVLIHGVTGTCDHWGTVAPMLAQRFGVVAPDLLGHGESAKPRGDYSLGAFASGIRDLLVALGHTKATIVGHSLGGGIAMQFAYQFPERCERLVLVSSGGLGEEVHPVLRAATLPGSEIVLPLIAGGRVRAGGGFVAGLLERVGLRPGSDLAEIARGYGSLADADALRSFVPTLRSVLSPAGQLFAARARLSLSAYLVVWGRRDRVIPVSHAGKAARGMPGARLEVFERSGHFPQLDDPARFASLLTEFIDSTEAAQLDAETLRERVRARRAVAADGSGSVLGAESRAGGSGEPAVAIP